MTTMASARASGDRSDDAGRWQAQVLRDESALGDLESEWDDLYERCSTATAFLSSAWLRSWWASYGQPGRLLIVLVRKDGQLVAAAALARGTRFGIPVLTPLGAGVSDFTDVLIDDSCPTEAADHLARELIRLGDWQVIDLPEVPDASAARHLVAAWPCHTWTVTGTACLELTARSIHELIATLPGRTAQTRRKKQGKIDSLGIVTRMVTPEDAPGATAVLLRLHRHQWLGRGMNPEHGRSRFAEHLARAVPVLVDRGKAHLVEYRLGGNVVAVDLLLGGHRLLGAYLYGLRPDLRTRIDVTQLLLGTDLRLAQRLGLPTVSLLRGDEPYKKRWRPRETRNHRVLLAAQPGLRAAMYAVAVRFRRQLSEFAKRRTPRRGDAGRRS